MKFGIKSAVAATVLCAAQTAYAADCGIVTMAEMNWASASLMANVDKIILEEGYGCNVEIVSGDTIPTFTSINEKGQPDVAGELWTNAVATPLNQALKEDRLAIARSGPITDLGEGWFVPDYVLKDNPSLKTVQDVLARPDLFPHPEDPSKGAFYGCPAGWGCQLANINLYRAFDMEAKGWLLVDPGSSAGLDGSIAKAVTRGDTWFGYYWSPTALVGKYNLELLDFGVPFGGKDNWDNCIVKPEQDCANPKPTAWTKSEVSTVVTKDFAKSNTTAMRYFGKRVFPGSVMNGMLVYMSDEQATGEDAAYEFLYQHPQIWRKWVSSNAAKKIQKAL